MNKQIETTTKLALGVDGMLKESKEKIIKIESIDLLQEIDYLPADNEIVLQLLPDKEQVTASGIIIPGYVASKTEMKAAIVATNKDSKYARGQVVRLDPMFWAVKNPQGGYELRVPTDYICGKPTLQCPEHFIKGTYTNINLENWK